VSLRKQEMLLRMCEHLLTDQLTSDPMEQRTQSGKSRASYFGNVKNRLGSKLPAGISQPPGFITTHCPIAGHSVGQEGFKGQHQIRNPKLRQYYLKEAAFSANDPTLKTLELCRNSELVLPKNKGLNSVTMTINPSPKQENSINLSRDTALLGPLVSPSTDTEYDKLTDVEAVPLPDGNVCLLALPSECSKGPDGLSCLKLFSRYITNRKGVVSGILLVTSNKIFFDPQKSHLLVQENGCEEYVFSCSVDDLASVFHHSKPLKRQTNHQSALKVIPAPESHDLTSHLPMNADKEDRDNGEPGNKAKTEMELTLETGGMLTAAATFCCGGPDSVARGKSENEHPDKSKQESKVQHGKKGGLPKPKVLSRDVWFMMEQERSDKLYAYLSQHRPDLCIHEGAQEDDEEWDEEEFVLLDEEEEVSPHESHAGEDWEMVSVEDSTPKVSISSEPEGLGLILSQSVILDAQQVKEISRELPPRTIGHTWHLSYSTDKHGASLKTLYRKLSSSDSPVLILIKDTNQQSFRWTGENSFFIKGDLDSFAVGGGSGHFGLWVDERLLLGRSSPCFTFNNCSLSETSDFTILELEAWTFG
ncbi:hypothetical protein DNTS_016211, partial [Danionella cerebrum]